MARTARRSRSHTLGLARDRGPVAAFGARPSSGPGRTREGSPLHLNYRNTCRACGSAALTKVIDLGEQHVQGVFIKPGAPLPPLRRVPLVLVRCDPTRDESSCGLLQTSCTLPPEILYSTYWYRSGMNRTMRDHLSTIAAEVVGSIGKSSARVLDIGCNDA